MKKIFYYLRRSIFGNVYSRLHTLCVVVFFIVIFPILTSASKCNAQELVSYCDSCVDINANNLYNALIMSFGTDSTCQILNDKLATLVVVYVDSLCRVTDSVLIVNSIRAKHSSSVRKKLLNTMKRCNMTFQACFETPPLFEDPSPQRLCKIKSDCRSYLISYYNNHVPVRIWVSKSDFLKWVENRSDQKHQP